MPREPIPRQRRFRRLRMAIYEATGIYATSIDDSHSDYGHARFHHLGPFWRSGRLFIHFPYLPKLWGETDHGRTTDLRFSWSLGRGIVKAGASVGLWGGESNDDASASVTVPGLSLWLTLERWAGKRWWNRRSYFDSQREVSFMVFADEVDMRVHWRVWANPFSWSNKIPRWRDGSWSITDFFLGKMRPEREILSTHRFDIPMPEGTYPATIQLGVWHRRRARWFTEHIYTAEITPDAPVSKPGKGENSWDQGDDATFSMSTPARTVEEAVANFIHDTLRTRIRRGWRNGMPPGRVSA